MADNRFPNNQQLPQQFQPQIQQKLPPSYQQFQHQSAQLHQNIQQNTHQNLHQNIHHNIQQNNHQTPHRNPQQNYQSNQNFQYQTQLIPTTGYNFQPGTTVIPAKVTANPDNPLQQILTYTDSNGVQQQVILNKSLNSQIGGVIQATSINQSQQPPSTHGY